MYKNILLAADGSNNALRAANEAIKIASLSNESVIDIVYVADYEKTKEDVLHASSADELMIERRKKIQNVEKALKDNNVSYKVTILHGLPGPEIIKYANERKMDIVVIGSRGLNSLQEMVIGSVSHKVMKRVYCPVLIVK
ncbi:universal stress protein [Ureibacillus chungkukjangi]|uniref:Nucleotide-binding universal stress UspA family protein n=1 Tax=Ureibacillus chungkukjangi TaxID=1202712 RepID=A0A318TNI4_9BACL|nr:universal stress protein [Ureibacillus chungkukjangi]MCM3388168.1 universal stress protein [Ureibacillus chungkukjangi]MDI7743987.1 universal stress protein [Lysinibacillus fusiformis]PYF06174.1 nucleotide-binding universal stress UspA family protein [Ureibacillus chungkukjangi]